MKIEINESRFLIYIKIFFPLYWIPKIGTWWYKKYRERLVYQMADDFLVCEQGVFFFSKKKVPYSAIREVSVFRGPILQLFGGSVIKIHTAGQNRGFPEMVFICPLDPDELVQEITKRSIEAKEKK